MADFLARRWTRQPQGPVEVDWGNPLTRGLIFLSVGPFMARDLAAESPFEFIQSPGVVATQSGAGRLLNGSNQSINTKKKFTSTAGTMLLLTEVKASPTGSKVLACQTSDDAGNNVGVGWQGVNFIVDGWPALVNEDGTDIPPGVQSLAGTWSASAALLAYRNGKQGYSYGTIKTPSAATGDYNFEIGCFRYSGGRLFFSNHVPLMFGVWDWQMGLAPIRELALNNWQLLKPRRAIIYSFPSGGITIPTLSLPGVQDVTPTGARPKVTLTF